MMTELFYLQDARQVVGNAVLWWAQDWKGYTCDLRRAHVFTKEELKRVKPRSTDIPWPKAFVDEHQMPVLDIQKKPLLEKWMMKNESGYFEKK
jgi:hypothetical protein